MGEDILKTNIKREKNWLYYCGTDEFGNIKVCKAEMSHKGRPKKKPLAPKAEELIEEVVA